MRDISAKKRHPDSSSICEDKEEGESIPLANTPMRHNDG